MQAPEDFSELQPPQSESDVKFAFMTAQREAFAHQRGDLLIFLHWDREKMWEQIKGLAIRAQPQDAARLARSTVQ